MAKRLVSGSPEIQAAIRALGLEPNEVSRLTVTIDPGDVPRVHVDLMPDHERVAALLAAMKNVDYDIAVDQSTKLYATTEPERCTEQTELTIGPNDRQRMQCELRAGHTSNPETRSHAVHPDDSTLYRW
jgi:hypothetical protein